MKKEFKELREVIVKVEDQDFAEWAFGKEGWEAFVSNERKTPLFLAEAWNKLHGDLFKIDLEQPIMETLEKMKEEWRKAQ
jgi:hypothetical protein